MLKSILLYGTAATLAALGWWSRSSTPAQEVVPTHFEAPASAKNCPDNPVELGAVCWLRNLDSAMVRAEKTGKPIFILFQEVPGCSNCTRFGSSTLSHPLIVEAIEDLFVPLCIYNNKKGADAAALSQFGEPSWNNPVVRIVTAKGADLVPRMPDFRSQSEIVSGINTSLQKTGQQVPEWLHLLQEEIAAREMGLDTATFSMYCFWSGEGTFGALPGVIETESGFQDGKEVVKVLFDPRRTSKTDLEKTTNPKGIQSCAHNGGFREDKEPKYYLYNTPWKYVPMTSLQACRANSRVGQGQPPEVVLSPRQKALYETIQASSGKKRKSFIGAKDLAKAWNEAVK